ncbi:hypothetical protein FPV67DRAFT_1460368 [Lyophyllum atratum]|nr:hypothetical protein FPV67DRAFT_1460368 [Lyophyllum atratum]
MSSLRDEGHVVARLLTRLRSPDNGILAKLIDDADGGDEGRELDIYALRKPDSLSRWDGALSQPTGACGQEVQRNLHKRGRGKGARTVNRRISHPACQARWIREVEWAWQRGRSLTGIVWKERGRESTLRLRLRAVEVYHSWRCWSGLEWAGLKLVKCQAQSFDTIDDDLVRESERESLHALLCVDRGPPDQAEDTVLAAVCNVGQTHVQVDDWVRSAGAVMGRGHGHRSYTGRQGPRPQCSTELPETDPTLLNVQEHVGLYFE